MKQYTNRVVFMKKKFGYFLGIACLLAVLGPVAANAKCKCGKPSTDKVVFNSDIEESDSDKPVATSSEQDPEEKVIVQN